MDVATQRAELLVQGGDLPVQGPEALADGAQREPVGRPGVGRPAGVGPQAGVLEVDPVQRLAAPPAANEIGCMCRLRRRLTAPVGAHDGGDDVSVLST